MKRLMDKLRKRKWQKDNEIERTVRREKKRGKNDTQKKERIEEIKTNKKINQTE